MDNYLDLLPQELINTISSYLDYTEISILEQEFGSRINYQLLLTENYPALSKILKLLKEKDIKWKDYPYSKAYDSITLMDKYLRFRMKRGILHNENINTRTNSIPDFIDLISSFHTIISDINNMVSSYYILVEEIKKDLIKYKILFPNIKNGDVIINEAYEDYWNFNSLDNMIESFNYFIRENDIYSIILLYIIFIYILEHLDTLDEYKDKIIKIDVTQKSSKKIVYYDDQFFSAEIVYQHIIEFIRAQEKYQRKLIV